MLDERALRAGLWLALDDPALFSARVLGRPLRPYQLEVARAVLDSIRRRDGRTFTVLMARQCLDGDTVVLSRDGAACRIRHHPHAWPTGAQPVLRLELRGGRSLLATATHPIRTRRGWVPLDALSASDEVAVLRRWPLAGCATVEASLPRRRNAARADAEMVRLALDARHARLLGWLAAGGRLARAFPEDRPSQGLLVASREPSALDEVEALARALFPGLAPRRRERGRLCELYLSEPGPPGARPLRDFVRAMRPDRGFPRAVFDLPEPLMLAFAQALAEPRLGGERVQAEPFLRYVQVLLARLGREARISRRGGRPRLGGATPTPRAADEQREVDGEVLGWSRVRGIAAAGTREVWDLCVPGKGWFIANGIAVHNSGKNELSAHLEALLLVRNQRRGGQLVKAAPTMNPQAHVSLRRLEDALRNPLTAGRWQREQGRIVRLGRARAVFFSADDAAQVVGATADLLLEADEAQDVDAEKFGKDFRPMAAVANATTVLYGTAWSETTLLAEQIRANRAAEARDGLRRHFAVPWERVAEHNPAYGAFVQAEIARLGEEHPLIRTQYRLLDLEAEGMLFSPRQLALVQGDHLRQRAPVAGRRYVAGLDLAGADERGADAALAAREPRRDSTVVTVCELDFGVAAGGVREPRLRVVEHREWIGRPHHAAYDDLVVLLRDTWRCTRVVVDATGVGAGVAGFLRAALGPRVAESFTFSAPSKSALGYELLAAVNGGRITLYRDDGSAEWRRCWAQLRAARAIPGQHGRLGFHVPERDGHDDYLISLALAAHAARVGEPRRASGRAAGGAE